MQPERWKQIDDLFHAALRIEPAQRASFLARACRGDEPLRSEVESLISSHEQAESFIEAPAADLAAELLNEHKPTFSPGQAVGRYSIVRLLDKGGMGEVYLAEDTSLHRKIALKLLPKAFMANQDRLRRFEQEARAASALNHPNIITIYEITQAAGSHIIATEFVEGETLRCRLSRSRLTLLESLNIAIQVADALSAAHKAGIVHRDIKPENIMIRPDGYMKVVDFGLAKLAAQPLATVDVEGPTAQVRTGSGIVIGTVGYMSPEQARGLAVDNRSDIFSLGAVIYEMVAHRKPFEGETPSDTLASILKSEPPPLSGIAPDAPPELDRIVSRALQKDREERYESVRDVWVDLKTLKEELSFKDMLDRSAGSLGDKTAPALRPTQQQTGSLPGADTTQAFKGVTESITMGVTRYKWASAFAMVVLLLLAAGSFGVYKWVNRSTPALRFSSVKFTPLTNSGKTIDAAISPDGKYVVYATSDGGLQSLYIRQFGMANDKVLLPPAPIELFGITFSPDSNEVFYGVKVNRDAGTLYRISLLGGTPLKVLEKIDGPISFSPDGKRFALIRANYPNPGESAVVIARVDGSVERDLAIKKLPERFAPIFFTGPSWSPDDKVIAVTLMTVGGRSKLLGFSPGNGREQELSSQSWPFAGRVQWLSDMTGLLVVAGENISNAMLWAIDYPGGRVRQVTNDFNCYRAISLTRDADMFTTIQSQGVVNLWTAANGDSNKAVQLPTGNVNFYSSAGNNLAWAPDGRIAFVSNEGGKADIWLVDADGGNRRQLTKTDAMNLAPVVSSDGRYLVYVGWQNGRRNIWRMNLDGSSPVRLTSGALDSFPSLTPDGRWVVYSNLEGVNPTVWKIPVEGGTPVQVTDHPASAAAVSPDGQRLALLYSDSSDPYSPANRLAVTSFESPGKVTTFEIPPSMSVVTVLQWSTDSKSVLYTATLKNVTNIWSQPVAGGPSRQITDFKDMLITSFAWSRDGKKLACSRGTLVRDAVLVSDAR